MTRRSWKTCGNATTPPSPPGSSTTGSATGTRGTTPATPSAAGCAVTRNKSSCSPGISASTGRITSASAEPKPPSDIRPSPDTGTLWRPSPGGAASAATSTPPPPTASPHSTPSPARSPGNPGYRHSPPQPDTGSRTPVNGHISRASPCTTLACGTFWRRNPMSRSSSSTSVRLLDLGSSLATVPIPAPTSRNIVFRTNIRCRYQL